MKKIILALLTIFLVNCYGQTIEDHLCITNKRDQIYAVIGNTVLVNDDSLKDEYSESYSDFIYHTGEFQKIIKRKVKTYISSLVKFNNSVIKFNKHTPFMYIFIKKGAKHPKIIYGVDSWASLQEQYDKYYGKESGKENQE